MSEDLKKHARTQGKYSDVGKSRNQDRRHRISPAAKELAEKKTHKRYSNESKRGSNSFTDEDVCAVKYAENSDHSFNQLEEPKEPIEISKPGNHVISTTSNGESKIFYDPCFLEQRRADNSFDELFQNIHWYSKNVIINGEERPQPRMVAWFGPYPYSYSGATLEPAEMPHSVLKIKQMVETCLRKNGINAKFNSVLLNLYRNNKDSVAWHSDDESTMGICPTIASVSLGETRRFELRPKKKQIDGSPSKEQAYFVVHLMHGSLIVMDGCMQDDWQHRIPKEYHDRDARINLTFRTVYSLEKCGSHKYSARAPRMKDIDTWNSHKVTSSKISFVAEDFPPLSSDTSPAYSRRESNIHKTSNSSWGSVLNKSDEAFDSETSIDVKVKVENDDPNFSNSYSVGNFETSGMKHHENTIDVKVVNDNPNFRNAFSCGNFETSGTKHHENTIDVKVNDNPNFRNAFSCGNFETSGTKHHENTIDVKVVNDNPNFRSAFSCGNFETSGTKHHENPIDVKVENDEQNFNNASSDDSFETIIVKHPGNAINENISSLETNSSNRHLEYSVKKCPSNVTKETQKRQLNVLAKEFVPTTAAAFENQGTNSCTISLEDLLHYEVKVMHGRKLLNHAYNLKLKVEERLSEFIRFDREELEFLCLLTDGSQTDKNQKLITSRMVKIVSNNLERSHTYSNARSSYDRSRGYGKQNNTERGIRTNHNQKRVIDCKARWKTIRDSYMKNKRLKTGSPATANSEYGGDKIPLLKDNFKKGQMFLSLVEAIRKVPTFNSSQLHGTSMSPLINDDRKETVVVADRSDGIEPPRKKKCYSKDENKEGRDERKTTLKDLLPPKTAEEIVAPFFKKMERDVYQLPPHLRTEAVSRVFQVVSELKMRAMNERSCSSNNK